jgi:hypothetical protein
MFSPGTDDLIDRLERALDFADREPFRKAAEAALAAMPQECRGPGADYRRVAPIWRDHFHPPTVTVVVDASARYVDAAQRARAFRRADDGVILGGAKDENELRGEG